MKPTIIMGACALAAAANVGTAFAQEADQAVVVVPGKRENRVSKGATGLRLEIKDTPQTISTIDKEEMEDFGTTGSNEALRLGTGINVEQYETNRAVFNARGFEVQLTQVDGLGMTNDYGTVAGQQDTYIFERIELIRGANGLLTGVGNSSGTINYVRKRPTNKDGGEVKFTAGENSLARGALDYNKVLSSDGAWAGRLVVAHEDKDSYLRGLHDKQSTVYGVIDGQIGSNGMLTFGFGYQNAKQKSPMWGSLTLNYADGRMADFDVSSSTSQDWTFWNTKSKNAFVEYTHTLSPNWEAKATYTVRNAEEEVRLFYAFPSGAGLNNDNTGLSGWPYGSFVTTDNSVFDVNLNGQFDAFGRKHSLIAGISRSHQKTATSEFNYDTATYQFLPLPAFPYAGNVYPEPVWSAATPASSGEQTLTRFYGASRFNVADGANLILGMNAVRLEREGNSRYGSLVTNTNYPDTKEVSPYVGVTYDFTKQTLGYVSYSDIFQNQDQVDIQGSYLAPMTGVNYEAGIKSDWMNKKMLTTVALFSSEQQGIATFAGISGSGTYYYEPKDVKSKGIELEATGKISKDSKLTVGLTKLKVTGPDGNDIYEWIPRTVVNFKFDTKFASIPQLKAGIGGRWQSDTSKTGGARQDAYFMANMFASYEVTDKATLRLNINNITDKKYIGGLSNGAIYGAPRTAALTLDYQL
ncbi:TonB-dependent siderophore receptor [Massilia sp. CF038]|uniref:TonB-dependent siderophore receptor n=1 Tax=Massilia sp. CF038 TaxID=1881045 RepID=UPI00091C5D10|nr:TonB-dependent siderophore receptor [Massilia sp. CF038]SHH71820.1 outer-membrane receptor for ferric coprogen and ferric-rhodotorulic acid [Massilia sp. CF038]